MIYETTANDELVFVPLGGLGEIGMNLALYGFGPRGRMKWLMVDCGIAFTGPEHAGIDLMIPDTGFIEKMKQDLVGLVITHAHEDHIGAVADVWPKLGCQLYATRFAAELLQTKRLSEPGAPEVPIKIVPQGGQSRTRAVFGRIHRHGPFDSGKLRARHQRRRLGSCFIRATGRSTRSPALARRPTKSGCGRSATKACSPSSAIPTNILREGVSPSEGDVAGALRDVIAASTGRVVVTTFASNVARIRAVAEAASAAQRNVVLVGRAMERVVSVARDCGYLDGVPDSSRRDAFAHLPRDKVVLIATGSQGENRAAIARISEGEHPAVTLNAGDKVIFSSRTIPGNEREVGRIVNNLIRSGVDVVTDRNALVHASGHPRRGEVSQLYAWLRPQIAIPAHGEEIHLSEHAAFARAQGADMSSGPATAISLRWRPASPPSSARSRPEEFEGRQYVCDGGRRGAAGAPEAGGVGNHHHRPGGDGEGRPRRRARRDDRGNPGAHARWRRDGRNRRRRAVPDLRPIAEAEAARRRPRLRRDRKGGAQRGRVGLGQAAGRSCAGGRGVNQREDRMIGRLNHVAIAVKDLAASVAIYRDALGAIVSAPVALPEHGVIVAFVELQNTKIELLQPLGDASPLLKFVAKNPDGAVHHLCYEVDDIIAAKERLKRSGARILGDGEPKIGAHGKPVLFLNPKDFAGTLIELEQA